MANKASGSDGIPAVLFEILKDDAMKVLRSTCKQIWITQHWPHPAEPGAEGGSKKCWTGGDVNCKRKSHFSWIGLGSHCRAIQAGP